jgi:excisionase family DNA binding protein
VKTATVGEGYAARGSSPGYLTVKQAAQYASLSERTIRSMIARDTVNALPVRRIGRKVLIHLGEFDNYLEQYRVSGRPGVVRALREIGIAEPRERVQKRGHVAA